jgi:3-hydroxyisobutyrate dehydrogenase
VGVIGVGQMGGGIAASLARSGREVYVRDVDPAAIDRLAGAATACESPAEVANRADVVFVVVLDPAQVADVLEGPGGLLEASRPELLVGIMSTVPVHTIREFASRAAERGVTVIDVGITGGVSAAADGTLVTLVGGDDATFSRAEAVLQDCCSLVLHMGPLGAGMAAKLARNVMTYGAFRAAYEAGLLLEHSGIDIEKFLAAVRHSESKFGGATAQLSRGSVQPLGEDADPQQRWLAAHVAMLAHKDLHAAQDLASELGVLVPMIDVVEQESDAVFGVG